MTAKKTRSKRRPGRTRAASSAKARGSVKRPRNDRDGRSGTSRGQGVRSARARGGVQFAAVCQRRDLEVVWTTEVEAHQRAQAHQNAPGNETHVVQVMVKQSRGGARQAAAPAARRAAGPLTLAGLFDGVPPLTAEDRMLIVRQALILIEQNYAHLPLKRAMHAVDPVQRLRLLLQELEDGEARLADEIEFHAEMTDIFTSLRDLHTLYLLPQPYSNFAAFLPFMVEECFEPVRGRDGKRTQAPKYIVTRIDGDYSADGFVPGVELVYWNGMPIERAIRNNAERYGGSNREARRARGIESLTTRVMEYGPPPDEDWVIVRFRTPDGAERDLRFDWLVESFDDLAPARPVSDEGRKAARIGRDRHQSALQRVRTGLFGRHARQRTVDAQHKIAMGAALGPLESAIPEVIEADKVRTASGTFGYIRIRTFEHDPSEELVNEFVRLLAALPREGLIIDVRGNGGGYIDAGECLLQLLTPSRIQPEPVQFLNSRLNLEICRANGVDSQFDNLEPWAASMGQALRTGAPFSSAFPLTSVELCNQIGQRYFGPVVLITDGLCYSTTDIFAAGFKDHAIGTVIGTSGNTGAGGANVWEHADFVKYLRTGARSEYQALPRGAGMTVSMRRTLRVGDLAGTPVEDLGVEPNERHYLTRRDILGDNADLKDFAGRILKKSKVRDLSVQAVAVDKRTATLRVTVRGMNRVDVYVSGRSVGVFENVRRSVEVEVVVRSPRKDVIEVHGFDDDVLVGRLLIPWQEIVETAPVGTAPARAGRSVTSRGRRISAADRLPTPNAGDDLPALVELRPPRFGGRALRGSGGTATTTTTTVRPWRPAQSLLTLRGQVNALAPGRSRTSDGMVGDAAHAARNSDHNPWVIDGGTGVVTACDITHDPAGGCDAGVIAEALRTARDSRIKYIIFNRQIANSASVGGQPPWTWRPYSGANPHTKHVHISVKPEKSLYDSTAPWPVATQ